MSCYKMKALSSYLDVIAVTVVELSDNEALHGDFLTLLQTFSESTFTGLKTFEDFTENPDLVDDYFEMVKRYMQPSRHKEDGITVGHDHLPIKFAQLPFVIHIVNKAIDGMCIDHREAFRAIHTFLTKFIELGLPSWDQRDQQVAPAEAVKAVVQGVIAQVGGRIVVQVFTATMGTVSTGRLGRLGVLLKRLFELHEEAAKGWVQQVLSQITTIPGPERERCCTALLSHLDLHGEGGDDKFGEILEDFARICRLVTRPPPP